MTEEVQQPVLPPVKLAFIIDGEVADILHTDDRLSAIFLSQPKVLDITALMANPETEVVVGSLYNEATNEFSAPTTGA